MDIHELRKTIDGLISQIDERLENEPVLNADHREGFSAVRAKLREARMWARVILEVEKEPK